MGEIKSTLDLIMEKTRNMSLSAQEKEELKTRELKGRLKGFVRKGLEGDLSADQFRKLIEKERGKSPQANDLLMAELVARIEPEGENERIFQIMEEVSSGSSGPFKKVLSECSRDMERQRDRSEEDLREELRKRGVSGSAVLPNPARDPAWRGAHEERRAACRRQLEAIAGTRTTPARSSENSP